MKVITYWGRRFYVFPQVYMPSDDTFMLAERIRSTPAIKRACDVGCGCGLTSVLLAERCEKVVAVDVSPYAALNTLLNAEVNGFLNKLDVICGNMLSFLSDNVYFDLVVFNPPYLPVRDEDPSYSGGEKGVEAIKHFIKELPRHDIFREFLTVLSTLADVPYVFKLFEHLGFRPRVVSEKKLSFEKLILLSVIPTLPRKTL